jgi:hypothetical protein
MTRLPFPAAVQAIAALEARTRDYERRLANGYVTAEDAEFVIRDCSRALDAIRADLALLPEEADPITAAKAWGESESRMAWGDR